MEYPTQEQFAQMMRDELGLSEESIEKILPLRAEGERALEEGNTNRVVDTLFEALEVAFSDMLEKESPPMEFIEVSRETESLSFGQDADGPMTESQRAFLQSLGLTEADLDVIEAKRYESYQMALAEDMGRIEEIAQEVADLVGKASNIPYQQLKPEPNTFAEVFDNISEMITSDPRMNRITHSISGVALGTVCCDNPDHEAGVIIFVPTPEFRAEAREIHGDEAMNFLTVNSYDNRDKEVASVKMRTDKARELAAELVRMADLAESL